MPFRPPNIVQEEPGDITKCSDSTNGGKLGKLLRRWSALSQSEVTFSTSISCYLRRGCCIRFVLLWYNVLRRKTLPNQVERKLLDNICHLSLLISFKRSQEILPDAPTLPMGVNLASFHVAGQLSVNLRLRSRRVFPIIYGTNVLIMNVSEALLLIE